MSCALSLFLQGLNLCVRLDPFDIGFQKIFIFILTIFHHQMIKCLFPGDIGSSMLVLFSLVEHLNLAYPKISNILLRCH